MKGAFAPVVLLVAVDQDAYCFGWDTCSILKAADSCCGSITGVGLGGTAPAQECRCECAA